MTSQTAIINSGGDFDEIVERLSRHLGKDRNRRAVLDLIYGRGSRYRSKKQIAEQLGIGGTAQVIQNALDHMAKHHLIVRVENDGHVDDGSRWVYGKERFVQANRPLIKRYADDPAAAKKVATKRRPSGELLSLVKQVGRPSASRGRAASPAPSRARLRIALLVTNPDSRAVLRTDMEARLIEEGIALGGNKDAVDIKLVLAPDFDRLVDTLNGYRPDVIHFAGHGGGGALLLDNERADEDGGTVLDFDLASRVIEASSGNPRLLVLSACDTVAGADCFLDTVPAVIAMAASIGDAAAITFSARFYRSLSGGATIAQSLTQAKLGMEHRQFADAALPTLLTRSPADGERKLL